MSTSKQRKADLDRLLDWNESNRPEVKEVHIDMPSELLEKFAVFSAMQRSWHYRGFRLIPIKKTEAA